jgi:putative hemin transport protein
MATQVSNIDARQTHPRELHERFLALRRERKLRHRDAAAELGLSEGEAVAAAVGSERELRAVRLAGPWSGVLERVPSVGTVMALTRNESAVHEKVGRYRDMSHDGLMGLAVGAEIDLRIFYGRWAHGYAVTEDTMKGVQRSLQFYDAAGEAVHKVFARETTDLAAWERLVAESAHEDQAPGLVVRTRDAPAASRDDTDIDVDGFRNGWLALRDTHDFFPLLRRRGVTRTQALRLAPAGHARRVDDGVARRLLASAARDRVSIMCFVGNPGMIQIHTGPVRRVEPMGPWLNVLDPGFNLHLREERIAATWQVRKPTADGDVNSIELFDAAGETIAMFFGERKPGLPERDDWRRLLAEVAP